MRGWVQRLDWRDDAFLHVTFELSGREVIDYAVVLTIRHDGQRRTVRVYDGAHGVNDLHRHTLRLGKQPAEVAHAGTLGEGMRAAIAEARRGYRNMIESWRQQ